MATGDVPEKIRTMAEVIKPHLTLAEKGKVIISPEAFEATLVSEGLDMKQVKAVQNHTSNVFMASLLAVGEFGADNFKTNPDLESVTFDIALGNDRAGGQIDRSRTEPDGKGGDTVKWGVPTTFYNSAGGKEKAGFRAVRNQIAKYTEEALAS